MKNNVNGSNRTLEEVFEHYVVRTKSGCWKWTGTTDKYGYGRIEVTIGGQRIRTGAHRVSYTIHVGPIPDGLNVLHHCDNPPCTNPKCLYVGTQSNNMLDMYLRGRR